MIRITHQQPPERNNNNNDSNECVIYLYYKCFITTCATILS